MELSSDEIFERVRDILVEYQEVKPGKITIEADLYKDIGVFGDDSDDLFMALDKEFTVDWMDLDLGIHFRSEGWGLPFPWQLKNSHYMFKLQPCSVGQLVTAIESGRWHGTKVERRHPMHVAWLYAWSILLNTLVFGGILLTIAVLIHRWLT